MTITMNIKEIRTLCFFSSMLKFSRLREELLKLTSGKGEEEKIV
jgi:hypothetical protein